MVPRAGFEPATTVLEVDLDDLEGFKLFAEAKLNLSYETVRHYASRVRAFLKDREIVSDRDIQLYIQQKKETCKPDYVSNIISSFKAYFRNYKRLGFMDGYKHPSSPLRIKKEIEPEKVKFFIEAIDDLRVKCIALLLATSGLRKGEVWNLRKSDIDRQLRCIIPNCHSGKTKHSGISFFNEEAEACLRKYEKGLGLKKVEGERLFVIGHEQFLRAWRSAREKSGVYLKPKDFRDFFSQEMGKKFVPDRFIDVFQGRAPRNVLAKHYTPQGIRMLREIYDKAGLKVLS
jgi:integrase